MDVSTAGLAPVDLVARIMDDVRETFSKDEALALALAKEGVLGEGGRPYSSRTVSAWGTGKNVPPGHVVLVAAKLAGLRIDRYLYPEETGETDPKDRERLDKLEAHSAKLEEAMKNLALQVARLAANLGEHEAESDEGQPPD